jgi:hypothetical protein
MAAESLSAAQPPAAKRLFAAKVDCVMCTSVFWELEKMRREPAGQAIRESSVFPADSFEELERMLLTFAKL